MGRCPCAHHRFSLVVFAHPRVADIVHSFFKTLLEILFGSSSPPRPQADPAGEPPGVRYGSALFSTHHEASEAAKGGAMVAIVESAGRRKWAMLQCPCGCGEVLAMNLMPTHRPRWVVQLNSAGQATLYPSVDSTKCGAHFWLKHGRIIWAGSSRPHHS